MIGYAFKKNERFHSIFNHPVGTKMCGSGIVYTVSITENSEGNYWGWEDKDKPGEYVMIWPSRVQLEMCFPYGMKVAINKNEGRPVQLKIEQMQEFTLTKGESLDIGSDIRITIQDIRRFAEKVRLEIDCPRSVHVLRGESLKSE